MTHHRIISLAAVTCLGFLLSMAAADDGADDDAAQQAKRISPFKDITIDRETRSVEIRAWVALEEGYLEQVACSPGTREHESLVVIRAKPSELHAALLLLEYEPGRPGRWKHSPDKETVELVPPKGPAFDVLVRYDTAEDDDDQDQQQDQDAAEQDDDDAELTTHPIRNWIVDHDSGETFPDQPWIFGGSRFEDNPPHMGPGEHYVADMTGSIIGLVTFGDEVLGLRKIIADEAAVHEPQWTVNTDAIAKEGSEVTIILQPRDQTVDS